MSEKRFKPGSLDDAIERINDYLKNDKELTNDEERIEEIAELVKNPTEENLDRLKSLDYNEYCKMINSSFLKLCSDTFSILNDNKKTIDKYISKDDWNIIEKYNKYIKSQKVEVLETYFPFDIEEKKNFINRISKIYANPEFTEDYAKEDKKNRFNLIFFGIILPLIICVLIILCVYVFFPPKYPRLGYYNYDRIEYYYNNKEWYMFDYDLNDWRLIEPPDELLNNSMQYFLYTSQDDD